MMAFLTGCCGSSSMLAILKLVTTLGEWMGQKWQGAIAAARKGSQPGKGSAQVQRYNARVQRYTVMPIPLHRDRRRERGFNQAEVVARRFCELTGDRLEAGVLGRVQVTVPQFGLSADERLENVKRAFGAAAAADYRFGGKPVLLFDDILTTGSTLLAARAALEQTGWRVVAAVVAARAGG